METLKSLPTENPTLSIEYLDSQLKTLPDLTKEEWQAKWRTSEFTELFPNLIFRLLSLEGRNQYAKQQKQRIFELGFTSFMELPWKAGGVAVGGRSSQVNKETPLWEIFLGRNTESDTESLITVEIGCLLLLGLSLKNKIDIIEAYNKLETVNKKTSFRSHITGELISTRSNFRQWVKTNNLDRDNGFEWDSEVTRLVLQLFPQNRFPRAFLYPTGYPPTVISTVIDAVCLMPTDKLLAWRSDIDMFRFELTKRLNSGEFKDDPPELINELNEKLNTLNNLLPQ